MKPTLIGELTELCDTFFNGRPAPSNAKPQAVTIAELIRRKVSVVRVGGKQYRVTVEELAGESDEKR